MELANNVSHTHTGQEIGQLSYAWRHMLPIFIFIFIFMLPKVIHNL